MTASEALLGSEHIAPLTDAYAALQTGFEIAAEQPQPQSNLIELSELSQMVHMLSQESGLQHLGRLQATLCSAFNVRAEYSQPILNDELYVAASVFGMAKDAISHGASSNDIETMLLLLSDIAWLPPIQGDWSHDLAQRIATEISTLHPSNTQNDADASSELLSSADDQLLAFIAEQEALLDTQADQGFASADDAAFAIDDGLAVGEPEPMLGVDDEAGFIDDAVIDNPGLFETEPQAAAPSNGTIWISEEEISMTRDAIAAQILPQAQLVIETEDPIQQQSARDDLAFQLSLIGNAMELLGTPSIGVGINAMRSAVETNANVDSEQLLGWCASLMAMFDSFDVDAAQLWGALSHGLPGISDEWQAQLSDEVSRVTIGLNPEFLAQRKTHAEEDDVQLVPADDVLPNVLSSMLRELPGNAEKLGASIRGLVKDSDVEHIDEARRVAHTLKGDANTVGVRGLANLTHVLEDVMIELLKSPERLTPEMGNFLLEASDTVEEIAEHLLGRGTAPDQLLDVYQQALNWNNSLLDENYQAPQTVVSSSSSSSASSFLSLEEPVSPLSQFTISTGDTSVFVAATPAPDESVEHAASRQISVDSRLLDELQRLAGEVLVMSRQVNQRLNGLTGIYKELHTELDGEKNYITQLDDIVALRGAALQSTVAKEGNIDPLELDQYNDLHIVSRHLLESQSDNATHLRRIDVVLTELEELRSAQERLNEDLQRSVMRARRVPFQEITPRLQRIVRQTSRQLLKDVDLSVKGDETFLDAELLERIVEPLSHVLRNSVDHGIEQEDTRKLLGKNKTGHIALNISAMGDSVRIEVNDDGGGLNHAAIREKAQRLGIIAADESLDDESTARLILLPGFSTRDQVSQTSGRGVGMDVVNQRIAALRGNLRMQSKANEGTQITIELPMSQSSANVIIAEGIGVTLAATANSVRRIIGLNNDDLLLGNDGKLNVMLDEHPVPATPIETLFGLTGQQSLPGAGGNIGLVVEDALRHLHVVLVQRVGDISSVVVKPISPHLPTIPAVRGMTQLGDGRLATVTDLGALIESRQVQHQWTTDSIIRATEGLPRVVVADDSLSVRRALEQLMQDAGYEVAAARDGLEALKFIAEKTPVAVLLDLEMPKMNGLEVCQHLRNQTQTQRTPVVMITSRATDKYKQMAAEAGVTRLLGKPFADDELVNLVRRLVGNS
jgi:chemotaxis protein histidine kinase CheA/CheY-like chemotaxis protein